MELLYYRSYFPIVSSGYQRVSATFINEAVLWYQVTAKKQRTKAKTSQTSKTNKRNKANNKQTKKKLKQAKKPGKTNKTDKANNHTKFLWIVSQYQEPSSDF